MTRGVLLIGDVIDDVLVLPAEPIQPDTDTPSTIRRIAGGSAANTACWLAADGTPATLIASVGADDRDRHGALLRTAGVTPRLTGRARPTGTIVVVSQGDQRAMLTDRGANEETSPAQADGADLAAHALLHVTAHVFTGLDRDDAWRALFAAARSAGVITSVAPGSAGLLASFGRDRFRAIVAGVDVLCAGADEAALLTGQRSPEHAALALGRDHGLVAVTMGAAGSVLVRDGALLRLPAAPATVVDVTGAGDAYAAGLLAALLRDLPDEAAGRHAAVLAARAVGIVGARP